VLLADKLHSITSAPGAAGAAGAAEGDAIAEGARRDSQMLQQGDSKL
jgi:hypothetical protein